LQKKIADTMRAFGGQVWLDEAEIKLGDSLVAKIREGIDSVDYVIALLSDKSVSSEWVTKELDIAMNQEIAGRKVKVLPILASQCELPGFLQGKLYADMSTPKAFRRSLPMLLDRLDAAPELVEKAKSGKPVEEISKNGAWVRSLGNALSTEDAAAHYHALKAASTYEGKHLLADMAVLDKLFAIVVAPRPPHIRIRALSVIASIEDESFAYRIEPLLEDAVPHVVCHAITTLSRLKAQTSAFQILELLRSTNNPEIRRSCLRFFSRVEVQDRSVVLSLISACEKLAEAAKQDRGLALILSEAAVNQATWGADEILPFLIQVLEGSDTDAQAVVLRGLSERSGNFFVSSPRRRSELGEAILRCCESETPEIASLAWMVALFLPDSLPLLDDREAIWGRIREGGRWAIEAWLEALEEYHLEAVFDRPGDHERLIHLIGKFGESIDQKLTAALAQIGSEQCLRFLSTISFNPKGWEKLYILRGALETMNWSPELKALVDRASRDLPGYTLPEAAAFASLIRYKAGWIELSEMLDEFPTDFEDRYRSRIADRKTIVESLKTLRKGARSPERRKITRIIKAIDPQSI
jgi:hypothetical protein